MMHRKNRRILASVLTAALLFTSSSSWVYGEETEIPEMNETLLPETESVPESVPEAQEFQEDTCEELYSEEMLSFGETEEDFEQFQEEYDEIVIVEDTDDFQIEEAPAIEEVIPENEEFSVEEEEELIAQDTEGTVSLTVDNTEIETCEQFLVSVHAPGADRVEVFYDYNGEGDWWNWSDSEDGESFSSNWSIYDRSGTYQLAARAYYYDGNGNETATDSEAVTMKVTAPKGSLSVSLPETIPSYLSPGDGLEFEMQMPENAEGMEVQVWYDPDEEDKDGTLFNWRSWETGENAVTVAVPAGKIEEAGAGKSIKARVHVNAAGYDSADDYTELPVIEVSQEAVIRVDKTDVLVNEEVCITVTAADGVTPVKALRIWDDGGYWDRGEEITPQNHPDWFADGVFRTMHAWGNKGEKLLYAEVTFDDRDDTAGDDGGRVWYSTGPVTVNVTSNGEVGAFEFSLDRTSVPRGELVCVTYGAAQNADQYWVDIDKWDEEHREWQWCDHMADRDSEGPCSFGTGGLEPGDYRVRAIARGYGYENADGTCNGMEYVLLTVTESSVPEGTVSLTVGDTEIETCEQFLVSVYAPGADRVEVFYDYNGEGDWWNWSDSEDGESFSSNWSIYDRSGTYQLAARAYYYDGNGNETATDSEAVTMKVTAPKGPLSVSLPGTLPSYLSPGDGLEFEMQMPENAEGMEVQVWYDPDEEDKDGTLFDWRSWETGENAVTVAVPAGKIEEAGAGKSIKARVHVNAAGYDSADDYTELPVIEVSQEAIISVDKTDVLVNEEVCITVTAADGVTPIKALRIWDDGGYWYDGNEITPDDEEFREWFDENGQFKTYTWWWNEGRETLFAEVTFDDWVEDAPGGDGGRTWFTTEPVELTISSLGTVGDFDMSIDSSRPDRTKTNVVTAMFTEAEHADFYWVDIHKWYEADNEHETEGWYWYGRFEDKDPSGNVVVNIDSFPLGTYHLYGFAAGNGYNRHSANYGEPVEMIIREPWLSEEDEKAADAAKALVDALPAAPGANDVAACSAAYAAISKLTDAQKAYLGEEVAAALVQKAQNAKSQAETAKARKDKQDQDNAAAAAVIRKINALNSNPGLSDKAAVAAARKAYDALSSDQKKLISFAVLNKLISAEASVKKAEDEVEYITISKKPSSVKVKAAKKGKAAVSWKKFKVTKKTKAVWNKIKKIEVQYSTDRSFKTGVVTKTLSKKKTKLTVKKLTAKKKYYFRVRYVEAKGKVSAWSAVKKVTAKK